jgi:glycosyltransferase involved in cell wall biosynthesis
MVIQRFRPDFGGQGVQLEQLCGALSRRGVPSVILCATRGRPSEWETLDGYRIRRLRADLLPGSATSSHLWMPTFGARVFMALMRLGDVGVVHVHGFHDGFLGARAFCRLRRVPLVFEMTLMGADDPLSIFASRPVGARLRHEAFRRADAYVAMSKAFLPSYAAAAMPPDRLHVIPQGVDTRRFRPPDDDLRRRARAEAGCGEEDPLIVFAGSLIERKGIDVLLAAWSRVHASRPSTRLVLVGRDDFPAGSADAVFLDTHLGHLPEAARHAVRRLGLREDPERFFSAADVFAFPSRREGFGTVIIEAMSCGLPSVVADMPGITDFVFESPATQEGAAPDVPDGIVVPQDDPDALAAALLDCLAHPARAAAIGQKARATVRERFDLDAVIAPAYERLYAELTSRKGRS